MNTYDEYLNEKYSLTFAEMSRLHNDILTEISSDNEAKELYDELVEKAVSYAEMRAKWYCMSRDERMEKDSLRTSRHDSLITHFNMLSRYLKMQGKAAEWRDKLGYVEEDPYYRKRIGDFACYIVFVNSICAR